MTWKSCAARCQEKCKKYFWQQTWDKKACRQGRRRNKRWQFPLWKLKLANAFICITKENKNLPAIPSWESRTFCPRLILKVSSGERNWYKYEQVKMFEWIKHNANINASFSITYLAPSNVEPRNFHCRIIVVFPFQSDKLFSKSCKLQTRGKKIVCSSLSILKKQKEKFADIFLPQCLSYHPLFLSFIQCLSHWFIHIFHTMP